MERMGAVERSSTTTVAKHLFAQPYDFGFLQAVRIFQRLLRSNLKVGEAINAQDEVLSFSGRHTYSLPSSDIYAVKFDNNKTVLEVNFFNIAGPHGAMPAPLAEQVSLNIREHDYALRDFLDMFNHRLLTIYYKIAEKYSFVLSPEPLAKTVHGSVLTSIAGLSNDVEKYLSLDTATLAQYAGILWQRPRSAAGLEQLLTDYFGIDVKVEQFVGSWVNIERRQRSFMGGKRGRNNKLGHTSFLGKRFWQAAHHFVVHVGPLDSNMFRLFVPTGEGYLEMCDLIRCYAPMEYTFQLKVALKDRQQLTPMKFGNESSDTRLGWTSVLQSTPEEYKVTIAAA